MTRRHYDQYCGLAHGLDLVGERWTLLIARDLLAGPQRYRDLAARQPGLASDMLTARLKLLTEHGLVEQVELPSPSRVKAYRLTERGEAELRPVLEAIARFGTGLLPPPGTTDARVDAAWAMQTISIHLDDGAPDDGGVRLETETGSTHLHHTEHGLRVSYTSPHEPAVTIAGATADALGILFGMLDPADTEVTVRGSHESLRRWRDAIRRAVPANLTVG